MDEIPLPAMYYQPEADPQKPDYISYPFVRTRPGRGRGRVSKFQDIYRFSAQAGNQPPVAGSIAAGSWPPLAHQRPAKGNA